MNKSKLVLILILICASAIAATAAVDDLVSIKPLHGSSEGRELPALSGARAGGLPSMPASNRLEIHHINVGYGDSTLIIAPNGVTILIDAGKKGHGKNIVVPYLKKQGINTISYLISTCAREEDMDALCEVLKSDITVGTVVFNSGDPGRYNESSMGRELLNLAETNATGDPVSSDAGDFIDLGDGGTMSCIYSDGYFTDVYFTNRSKFKDADLSSCWKIDYRDFQYFTGGYVSGKTQTQRRDTYSIDVETQLAERVGDVDVVKANRNGTTGTANATFINRLKANACVLSTGVKDEYHYTFEAIVAYEKNGAEVYQTQYDDDTSNESSVWYSEYGYIAGDVVITVDGSKYYEIAGIKKYKDENLKKAKPLKGSFALIQDKAIWNKYSISPKKGAKSSKAQYTWFGRGDGTGVGAKKMARSTELFNYETYEMGLYIWNKYGVCSIYRQTFEPKPFKYRVTAKASPSAMESLDDYKVEVRVVNQKGVPVKGILVKANIEYIAFSDSDSALTNDNGVAVLELTMMTGTPGTYHGYVEAYYDGNHPKSGAVIDTVKFYVTCID